MTEEYRAFLESRKPEASDHQNEIKHSEIPHWKPTEMDEEYLEHHGVKGMHWYVRRYQNYDGTRIQKANTKSHTEGTDKLKEEAKKVKEEAKFKSKTLQYKKSAQRLTDEELRERNQRMQLEVQYNQLRSTLQPKTKAQKRNETIKKIFVATASTAAAAIMTEVYKKAIKFIAKKASGGKIDLGDSNKKK